MIHMPDTTTRGDELRTCAARALAMAEMTGEDSATVSVEQLVGLLHFAAWACDVQDELKRRAGD